MKFFSISVNYYIKKNNILFLLNFLRGEEIIKINISVCIGITILFLGTCITPSIAIKNPIKTISYGNTLYVGGTGPDNYTKIQDAIDDASDGDTVFVYDDSSPYYEIIQISKSIDLIGENKDTTIVDGERKKYVFEIRASNVTICGFTIQNASGKNTYNYGYDGVYFGAVIVYKTNYFTISDCIIHNNPSEGLLFINSNHNLINGSIIINNSKRGIRFLSSGQGTTISNNILKENMVGIQAVYTDELHITVKENDIIENCDLGIDLENPHYSIVKKNNFIGNGNNTKIIFEGEFMHPFLFDIFWSYIDVIISTKSFKIKNNYWDRQRALPYIIRIRIKLYGFFSWMGTYKLKFFKFDLSPTKEPYDI